MTQFRKFYVEKAYFNFTLQEQRLKLPSRASRYQIEIVLNMNF